MNDNSSSIINLTNVKDALMNFQKVTNEFKTSVPYTHQFSGVITSLSDAGFNTGIFDKYEESLKNTINLAESMKSNASVYLDNSARVDLEIENSIPDEKSLEDASSSLGSTTINAKDESNSVKGDTKTVKSKKTDKTDLKGDNDKEKEKLEDVTSKETSKVDLEDKNGKQKEKLGNINNNRKNNNVIDINNININDVDTILRRIKHYSDRSKASLDIILFDPNYMEIIKAVLEELNYKNIDDNCQEILKNIIAEKLNIHNKEDLTRYIEKF